MMGFIQSISAAEQIMQGIIVHSWVQDCMQEFTAIIRGDWVLKRQALVILFGLVVMFWRGLWKMAAKVFGRWAWAQIW